MMKIPMIKKFEFFLILLLIIELIYISLFCAERLKQRSFKHDHIVRPYSTSNPVRNSPGGNNAMTSGQFLTGCIFSASKTYRVPAETMIGIMSVEGGHIGQEVGPNFNGTYDLGPMQVNSLWVPQLAQLWHVDYQTAHDWLRDNGCENIYVGAWILKQKIIETGTLYGGIAYYHSKTKGPGTAYANKVISTTRQKDFFQDK